MREEGGRRGEQAGGEDRRAGGMREEGGRRGEEAKGEERITRGIREEEREERRGRRRIG